MLTRIFSIVTVLAAIAAAQPAAAQVKMGDNNRINQTGNIKGAQTAMATGLKSTAINGNASIISATGGIDIGSNNQITQNGTIKGAQTAIAIGVMSTAINGNASIIAGR